MTRRLIRFASVSLALAGVVGALAAQAPTEPSSQQPTFRSGVDSVSVDVIVTDKQGRPVLDLKPEDFDVREAGKPQTIDAFKLVQTDDGRDDATAGRNILSFDEHAREIAREDNRLLVVYLDDYHVRLGNSLQIRQRISEFVRQLTPHDLVAVLTPLLPTSAITFSREHLATASVINQFEGRKYDYRPRNALEERYRDASPQSQEQLRNSLVVASLRSLCEYLGTVRDGRKSVLYVSEGMTGSLPPGMTGVGSGLGASAQTAPPTSRQSSQAFFESASLLLDLQRVFESASRSNTAIYTIDPRGLSNFEFGINEDVRLQEDRRMLSEATDSLRVVADQTDGRAMINKNDPMPDLKQMVRDSGTYYLLAYTSTVAARDGKFHEIQVKVKRKDVEVRARKGYWAFSNEAYTKATASSKPGPSAEVSAAVDDLVSTVEPGRNRAVSVWMGATRGPSAKAVVTLAWEAPPVASAEASDVVDRITLTAYSIYGDELYRGTVLRDPQAGRVAGQVTFEAPAGGVRAQVVAQNARGLRLESSDTSFDVPDFSATGPHVSSPFLFRGRTARDLQQIRAATAPMPVALRTFSRSERVLMRFSAYGPAGTVPTLTLRLLNRGGDLITALAAPTAVGGGAFEAEVALGGVPPGDYVLEITGTSDGEHAKRIIAIRVTS